MQDDAAGRALRHLIDLMARLRDPLRGCPWDRAQDFASIAPYTIEEAFEVADAIAVGDMAGLREEVGDLLLQVVFHARMAEEAGQFDFAAVAQGIADKLVARHPHVFAGEWPRQDQGHERTWEALKAAERARKPSPAGEAPSALSGIPPGLSQLLRARKLQQRAARVGFDWPDAEGPSRKVDEELAELRAASAETRLEEFGDLLFAMVNLARHWRIDPEMALRRANGKFESRFRRMEAWLVEGGRRPEACSLEELEALWQRAKSA